MKSNSDAKSLLILNGELKPVEDSAIPVSDRAIAFGAGLFETLSSYRGKLFEFDAHWNRLSRGGAALEIEIPEKSQVKQCAERLLDESGFSKSDQARVRITVTGGTPGKVGLWFIEATPAPAHAAQAQLITVPFSRNEHSALAGFKTINYGENVIAMRLASERGATEALFGNTSGNLCEGTWSNIFVCCRGRWITPPVSSGCLPGVTRALVLKLAGEIGLDIEERDLPLSRLGDVESAFLTSSLREIQPVASIDNSDLASVGDANITDLIEAYRNYVNS